MGCFTCKTPRNDAIDIKYSVIISFDSKEEKRGRTNNYNPPIRQSTSTSARAEKLKNNSGKSRKRKERDQKTEEGNAEAEDD
jgi:hypothetical protein